METRAARAQAWDVARGHDALQKGAGAAFKPSECNGRIEKTAGAAAGTSRALGRGRRGQRGGDPMTTSACLTDQLGERIRLHQLVLEGCGERGAGSGERWHTHIIALAD